MKNLEKLITAAASMINSIHAARKTASPELMSEAENIKRQLLSELFWEYEKNITRYKKELEVPIQYGKLPVLKSSTERDWINALYHADVESEDECTETSDKQWNDAIKEVLKIRKIKGKKDKEAAFVAVLAEWKKAKGISA